LQTPKSSIKKYFFSGNKKPYGTCAPPKIGGGGGFEKKGLKACRRFILSRASDLSLVY